MTRMPKAASSGASPLAAALLCAALVAASVPAQEGRRPAADEPRAVLVRGTEPVKGLPGFDANAFAAIYGEYRLPAMAPPVRVWATREALYFDPEDWSARDVGGYALLQRKETGGGDVIVAAELAVQPWTAFAAFPAGGPGADEDRFLRLFLERFTRFLAGAKLPTDASFPATVP